MITAVEQLEGKFISGIFAEYAAAECYLEDCCAQEFRIVPTGADVFPLYVLEGYPGDTRFVYTNSREDLVRLVQDAAGTRLADDDAIHFNVYRITKPNASTPPGTDQMGAWWHEHIRNVHLEEVATGDFHNSPMFGQFDDTLRMLERERSSVIAEIRARPENQLLVQRRRELDRVLKALQLLGDNWIQVDKIHSIEHLPWPEHDSSKIRIMEDFDVEDRTIWQELEFRGRRTVRPEGTDALILMKPD